MSRHNVFASISAAQSRARPVGLAGLFPTYIRGAPTYGPGYTPAYFPRASANAKATR